MPYLLRGLELPEEDMRVNVINTLISVVEEESAGEADIISEHATTIITTLLKNADHNVTTSPVSTELDTRMRSTIPCTTDDRQFF